MERRIWIDLDNSPHVPFFRPLVRELERRGYAVVLTAREYAQTLELARHAGLAVEPIGGYAGAGVVRKVAATLARAAQLARWIRRWRVHLALSHGSRAQLLAARALGIPAVVCLDYEWTERWSFRTLAQRILVPEVLRPEALRRAGFPLERVRHYPGLKEELYLPDFVPEPGFREALGIGAQQLLVVLRPPSLTANYRNERSVELFRAVLEYVLARRDVVAILLCRTQHDRLLVEPYRMQAPERIRIPERVLPGLQLLYWADVVISGGGTMNREAALLGTPVYSVFSGRRGAVDEWLAQQGRLRWLSRVEELRLEPRQPSAHFRYPDKGLAAAIVGHLEQCLRSGG